MKKALVLLSGGVDSSVLLWWVKSRGWELATMSCFFPGRRQAEIRAIRRLRRLAGSVRDVDVPQPFLEKPRPRKGQFIHYIPQRNLMYYGTAACVAEQIGADYVLGGHIRHDAGIFRDANEKYLKRVGRLILPSLKTGRPIRLLFPLIHLDKAGVVRAGARLGVPFEHTWSCSRDQSRPCLKCYACRERREGFAGAGVPDPLDPRDRRTR